MVSPRGPVAASDPRDRTARIVLRAVGAGLCLFGLVFAVVGLAVRFGVEHLAGGPRGAEVSVTGTVVDQGAYRDSDGDRVCRPVVSYQVAGQTYQVDARISSNSCPSAGSAVEVAVDVASPAGGRVVTAGATARILGWGFVAVGVPVALLGVGFLVAASRRARSARLAGGDGRGAPSVSARGGAWTPPSPSAAPPDGGVDGAGPPSSTAGGPTYGVAPPLY